MILQVPTTSGGQAQYEKRPQEYQTGPHLRVGAQGRDAHAWACAACLGEAWGVEAPWAALVLGHCPLGMESLPWPAHTLEQTCLL